MQTLTVSLGERSYPIYVGPGLLDAGLVSRHVRAGQVLVVSNDAIGPLYLERVCAGLDQRQVDTLLLPDGERFKNLETLERIFDALMANRHSRTTTLVADRLRYVTQEWVRSGKLDPTHASAPVVVFVCCEDPQGARSVGSGSFGKGSLPVQR